MRLTALIHACVFAGFTITGALIFSGCSAPATATAQTERELPQPLPDGVVQIAEASRPFVVVEAVGGDTGDAVLTAPARVEFREGAVARIGAPLNGRVTAVHVQTGTRVRAGAPLVTLDSPDAAVAHSAVEAVTASLREARLGMERERRMLAQGIGIEREALGAETRVAELESELARAQSGTSFVGDGSGGTVVLRAPISGTVVTLAATVGMTVQQGADPLVELGDPAALWIVADVFERDVPLLRDGAAARVELASIQGTLEGRVSSIGAVGASGLRTVPVRITLSSTAGLLRPGMYGRAEIAIATQGSLTLPAEAVLVKGKDTVVYVEQSPTRFVRRSVVVTQPAGGRVRVLSGLDAGERVVTRGALLLDGAANQLL